MDVNFIENEKFLEIAVKGRIDATTAAELEEKILTELEGKEQSLAINLEAVEYISSAGLRVILKIAKLANSSKQKFCCFSLQPNVFDVFKISGFNTIIKIFDSKVSALDNL